MSDEKVKSVPVTASSFSNLSTPKNNNKVRGRKRKRQSSESEDSDSEDELPENTLEVEKNLYASAVKNNLDDVSVKKILKKVVTNDHVLAYVKLREEEEENSSPEDNNLRPKLTRAKVKELMKVSPHSAPWNLENLELTPIKHIPVKTRPEVKALIAQELPDDEDDDEYQPTHDEVVSEDEQTESCSDLDSNPRTPATPRTPRPTSRTDGPFKVPQEVISARHQLQLEEDATIALRTRSKLSLSGTPIEHIESSFVPPDEVPLPDVDDLWNQFLEECLNPASTSRHEDDDDADPEYNVAADPDAHEEDEEGLEGSIIKISKKELNDLVTELFHIMPEDINSCEATGTNTHMQQWEGKREPIEEVNKNISNTDLDVSLTSVNESEQSRSQDVTMSNETITEDRGLNGIKQDKNSSMAPLPDSPSPPPFAPARPPPVLREALSAMTKTAESIEETTVEISHDDVVKILPQQVLILEQQLRQHIQLAASSYLQLCVHPEFWEMAPTYMKYLETFEGMLAKNPKTVVNVCNMKPALELMKTWKNTVSANTDENIEMIKFIQEENLKSRRRNYKNNGSCGAFPPALQALVANSGVFLYPPLLPATPFRVETVRKNIYLRSEDELIALGLDQFSQYVEENLDALKPPRYHARHRWSLTTTMGLITKYMLPWIPSKALCCHINFLKRSPELNSDNPIVKFLKTRKIEPLSHKLLPFNPSMTLFSQPLQEIPLVWLRYIAKTSKRAKQYLSQKPSRSGVIPEGIDVTIDKKDIEVPKKRPLSSDFTKQIICKKRNQVPYILPKTAVQLINVEVKTLTKTQPPVQMIMSPSIGNPLLATTQSELRLRPISQLIANSPQQITNLVNLVPTPDNQMLVMQPITANGNTYTVDSSAAPIPSVAVRKYVRKTVNKCKSLTATNAVEVRNGHCKCCEAMRKIMKVRQKTITEYFKPRSGRDRSVNNCPCSKIVYPKITNKLKLLVSNVSTHYLRSWRLIKAKVDHLLMTPLKKMEPEPDVNNTEDLALAFSYITKLATQKSPAKHLAKKVIDMLAHFNTNTDCPIKLAKEIKQLFEFENIYVYRDFISFLTIDQAERLQEFHAYFVQNCVAELVRKVEAEITHKPTLFTIVHNIHNVLRKPVTSSCDLCSCLLVLLRNHPRVAQDLFNMFPHRTKDFPSNAPLNKYKPTRKASEPVQPAEKENKQVVQENSPDKNVDAPIIKTDTITRLSECSQLDDTVDREHNMADYEADHSSNGDEDQSNSEDDHDVKLVDKQQEDGEDMIMKQESEPNISDDESNMTIEDTLIQGYDSNSITAVSEDDVKKERLEWTKDEDKIILQTIKDFVAKKDTGSTESLNDIEAVNILANTLKARGLNEIRDRFSYLLELLSLIE